MNGGIFLKWKTVFRSTSIAIMEKGSYQTCGEEVLREEESEDIDYCIEDLNVREERKEDFLET